MFALMLITNEAAAAAEVMKPQPAAGSGLPNAFYAHGGCTAAHSKSFIFESTLLLGLEFSSPVLGSGKRPMAAVIGHIA